MAHGYGQPGSSYLGQYWLHIPWIGQYWLQIPWIGQYWLQIPWIVRHLFDAKEDLTSSLIPRPVKAEVRREYLWQNVQMLHGISRKVKAIWSFPAMSETELCNVSALPRSVLTSGSFMSPWLGDIPLHSLRLTGSASFLTQLKNRSHYKRLCTQINLDLFIVYGREG